MKRIYMSALAAVAAIAAWAQPAVTVESVERVSLPEGVVAINPAISQDGSMVVFSTGTTISRVDLTTGQVSKIADASQAYEIKVSPDSRQVVYNEPSYQKGLRYVSLKSANVADGKVTTIVKPSRHLNSGYSITGGTVNAVEKGKLKSRSLDNAKSQKGAVVSINYGHLDVTVDGTTTSIDPQGRGSYLWPSLSPDGTKIVYWCSGRGCFVCNLDGSDVKPIGELRGAVWAGNDMLVGMLDRDNGEVITSSAILASDLDGNKISLTGDDVIALYPAASADGHKVIFSDGNAQIYVITLK